MSEQAAAEQNGHQPINGHEVEPEAQAERTVVTIAARLEYLRGEIRAERISYSEIAELQSLANYIAPDDAELLEWAGRETEGPATPTEPGKAEESDGPHVLPQGENEYLVRLLFKIKADDPLSAIRGFIDQLNAHGLKQWTYRVEDIETSDIVHLDGYGKLVEV